MPWCPKCKNEYVEGIRVCSDCGSELVDALEEPDEPVNCELPEELPDDLANAVHLGRSMQGIESAGVYEEASKKAEEFKSGAWTLLLVGIAGIAVLLLLITGVLPLHLNPATQLMTCLVMGALFLILIVMGVFSYRSYQTQAKMAVKESSLKEELIRFCKENFNGTQIDSDASVEPEEAEEMRYFKRTACMKQMISENFLNLEEGYLDHFVDEIYPEIFEAQ